MLSIYNCKKNKKKNLNNAYFACNSFFSNKKYKLVKTSTDHYKQKKKKKIFGNQKSEYKKSIHWYIYIHQYCTKNHKK